jgi:hypothetical protein
MPLGRAIGLALSALLIVNTNSSALAQAGSKASQTKPSAVKSPAAATTALAQGYQMYQARRYAEASSLFWQAIQQEGAGANGYLYMAHCQYALGHVKQAIPYYRYVRDTYKDSPECPIAVQYLAKLDPSSGAANSTSGSRSNPFAADQSKPSASGNLLDRIELVRPIIGHPELSKLTINTIKEDLQKLPKPVQKILLEHGIKFCITTTLVDKYPDMAYKEGRGYDGQTLKRCPGMFKDDTVVICERVINEASNEVEGQILEGKLTQTFYHEIGHAIDCCLGWYSMKDDYRHAYYLDIARIPAETAGRLAYYMQKSDAGQVESCGEITSVCLGSGDRDAEDIKACFPMTMAFIKKKLNIDEMMKDAPPK